MDKRDWVVIYLSITMIVTQGLWFRAEKRVSFFEGQEAIYKAQSDAVNHICGEYEQPTTAEKRKHK